MSERIGASINQQIVSFDCQGTAAEDSSSFLFHRFFGPPSAEDIFYLQLGSDPLHGGRLTKIGNQSDGFVDFGLDRLDPGFAHAKGIAS
ncbi:hypothetical protein AYI68_g7434, partial [Smittium mucronatum]